MKYRIHYANRKHEEIVTEETRESILAWAQPIVDVTLLEEESAGKKQAAIQADSQEERDSSGSSEGVHVENKKRKTTSKKGQV